MKGRFFIRGVVAYMFFGFLLLAACSAGQWQQGVQTHTQTPFVVFNQECIDGLYSQLDLDDPDAVFKVIFSALDDEVIVYPTENYYYFTLFVNGKTISGNLRLDASDRDQGIIHIGYFEYDENGQYQDRQGKGKAFSVEDDVLVERLESLVYSVSYSGKTVIFRLNDVGMERPQKARLRENELFLGPIFDESGLKFYLLFNKVEKHFMYVLNEDGHVLEHFVTVNEDVVVGRRTGFSFFRDRENNRKILIGVHGRSTDKNNWYDGPFDQLPDNYVDRTQLGKYIEEAYPFTRGNVDKFGGYKTQDGSRAVIFPYSVYYEIEEITDLVETCKNSNLTSDKFYTGITPDPFQQYEESSDPEFEQPSKE